MKKYFFNLKKLKFWSLFFAFLSAQFGGGMIIGSSDAAYKYGIISFFYPFGVCFGLLIISFFLGKKFRQLKVYTIPEIFSKFYKSKILHLFSALILIFTMIVILLAMAISFRKICLNIKFGFNNNYIFFCCWMIVILFTICGAFNIIVRISSFQIIFIIIIFFLAFLFLVFYIYDTNIYFYIFNIDNYEPNNNLIQWFLIPMCFTIIGQDTAQCCFISNNDNDLFYSSLFASFIILLCSYVPILIGLFGRQFFIFLNDESILFYIISIISNKVFCIIFIFAVLMAITTTSVCILFSIATMISLDIFLNFFNFQINTLIIKLIIFILGLNIFIFSFFLVDDIINIMIFGYSISVVTLFIPIIMILFFNKGSLYSAYFSFFIGGSSFLFLKNFVYNVNVELLSIFISFLFYIFFIFYKR